MFSGEFTENVKGEVIVDFQRFYVRIGGVRFDTKMKYVSCGILSNDKDALIFDFRCSRDF